MLQQRKRKVIIIVVIIVGLILITLGIGVITKVAKSSNNNEFQGDPYPSNIKFIGIYYNKDDENYIIKALDKDLQELKYEVDEYMDITNIHVVNNHIYYYSDAINELIYNKSEDKLEIKEVDSYSNNLNQVYIGNKYLVVLEQENIMYRPIAEEKKKFKTIASGIKSKVVVNNDIVYYEKKDGIYSYDIENEEEALLIKWTVEYQPKILNSNNRYLYLENKDMQMVYSFQSKKLTNINIVPKYLDLSANGILTLSEDNRVRKYVLINNDFASDYFTLPENTTISNADCFSDNYCYVDQIDFDSNHTYYVLDFKELVKLGTLDKAYIRLIEVNNENKS